MTTTPFLLPSQSIRNYGEICKKSMTLPDTIKAGIVVRCKRCDELFVLTLSNIYNEADDDV